VLFRPEEVHGASGIGKVFNPPPERDSDITDDLIGTFAHDFPIPGFYEERLSAIQTGGVHPHRFTRKKPADRQRFKTSLAEPSLLTVKGNAVLGGKIIKRGERGDEIRSGMKPPWNPSGKKVVQDLPPFFSGETKLGGQFRIERGLSRFHHASHDNMKGLV